jgi:hypothetical protein
VGVGDGGSGATFDSIGKHRLSRLIGLELMYHHAYTRVAAGEFTRDGN